MYGNKTTSFSGKSWKSVCILPVLNWNHLVSVELEARKISPDNIEVANMPAELLDLTLDCIISINLTLTPRHEVNHNGADIGKLAWQKCLGSSLPHCGPSCWAAPSPHPPRCPSPPSPSSHGGCRHRSAALTSPWATHSTQRGL